MNKIIKVLVVIVAVFTISSLSAQLKEGMVQYEVTDVNSSDPQMAAGINMMKGSELKVYFTPTRQRVDMDMMGGMMKMTTLHSSEDSNAIILMKMMGKKMKMTMSPDKMKKMQGGKEEAVANAPKVQHFKDDTKDILGYNCHKVVVNMNNDKAEAFMELYVTDEIVMIKSVAKGAENLDLGGTALQYTINVKGIMKMTYEATKIEKSVDDNIFDVNTDKYEEVDPAMFGGMIGG